MKASVLIRRGIRLLAGIVACFVCIAMLLVVYYQDAIPAKFYVTENTGLSLQSARLLTVDPHPKQTEISPASGTKDATGTVSLKLFGIIPVTTVQVSRVSPMDVIPGGTPFGIKLYTKGVMVVELNAIPTAQGTLCPAKQAGIQKGDVILSVDGTAVASNEELARLIAASRGDAVTLRIDREGREQVILLQPVLSTSDGSYKGGMWVRDSTAGIGTVTYYNPVSHAFAGLGHGICDTDTGQIMPLQNGEVCPVRITGIVKGQAGVPGELQGSFTSHVACGSLVLNNQAGIFGYLNQPPNQFDCVPVLLKQEVQPGKAEILCTLDGGQPASYEINIDRIDLNPKAMTKNMVITVTDPALIEKTGGIVQGMSGSPILQNGKLVGAVTHVFVNNPRRGYAIFAENMLDAAS